MYELNKEKETVTVKVNEDFKWVLNELANWTTFELSEFVSIKGSYVKEIYRRAKQFRMNGYWIVEMDEFNRLLVIPKSYRMSDINKVVLTPTTDELRKIWPNFKIQKKYGKGRGRPVVALKFVFDKEEKHATKNEDGTFSRKSSKPKVQVIKAAKYEKPEDIELTSEEREQLIRQIREGNNKEE